FKYVGDGSFLIGNKNPDFICTESGNHIIEFFGDYHHTKEEAERRIREFSEDGYKTLILWYDDFEDLEKLNIKIASFINNVWWGRVEVIEVVEEETDVYNISTTGTNNYFAECMLVHNCFSKYTESSMYTSWFDGYDIATPRFTSISHVQDRMNKVLAHRSIMNPFERDKKETPYCGSISDDKALQKCSALGIPLRFGNRAEPFLEGERKMMVTYEALKIAKDFDYPIIINTKGVVLKDDPWFKLITSMEGKVTIMVSIIHNDPEVSQRLETHAPSPQERWEVIRAYNDAGILALPRMEPLMAFINDDDEHMNAYADAAKDAGATQTLLDSYSYTVKSEPIRNMFYNQGFDFNRMFWATSEFTELGSYMIQKMMYHFKQRGIKTATFDFNSIPYGDDPTCCGLGEEYGVWNNYNLWTAVYEMFRTKGSMSFSEFDEKYYGHELHSSIRARVKEVWNKEKQDCWVPDAAEGIIEDGFDSEGNLRYRYEPRQIGQAYRAIIATFGDASEEIK
ncbi:MAG: hypothetical protein KKD44_28310, partial [Proteobacteria bacterium]|nr:hypothetical protein [Pseudomonadota bacterium]